jgi:nucleotide-binding universal stress UspA family protein
MVVIGGKKKQGSLPALGSVAESVTRHAHCPVLVVRPSPAGKVLAATDFSDPSMPAIAAGAAEARRLKTDLAILHAIELLPLILPAADGVTHPAMPADVGVRIRGASQRELDACVRKFRAKGGGLLREGRPAPAILREALELPARLLVVGTNGRTGLARLALGSVAEAVLRASPCSVLVVRLSHTSP